MKKLKEIYWIMLIIGGLILNSFVGFQVCPILLSAESNIAVILAIVIFLGLVIPLYYVLFKLLINKVNKL